MEGTSGPNHGSAYRMQRIISFGSREFCTLVNISHGLEGTFCWCSCVLHVTRHSMLIQPAQIIWCLHSQRRRVIVSAEFYVSAYHKQRIRTYGSREFCAYFKRISRLTRYYRHSLLTQLHVAQMFWRLHSRQRMVIVSAEFTEP